MVIWAIIAIQEKNIQFCDWKKYTYTRAPKFSPPNENFRETAVCKNGCSFFSGYHRIIEFNALIFHSNNFLWQEFKKKSILLDFRGISFSIIKYSSIPREALPSPSNSNFWLNLSFPFLVDGLLLEAQNIDHFWRVTVGYIPPEQLVSREKIKSSPLLFQRM